MAEPDGELRTLAVMFTDMAGSTEYAQKYGEVAARAKQVAHDGLLVPLVAAHRGTFLRKIGDALLAVFDAAADAARCALAMQDATAAYNRAVNRADDEVHVRVGFHWGKVVVYRERGGTDVTGSGANVAARVEGGGGKETDQVLLSEDAARELPAGEFAVDEFATIHAKGVGALRLFRLRRPSDRPAEPTRLLAQTEPLLAERMPESADTRGVHCLFVDPAGGGGHVRPVFVKLTEAASPDVRPRVECDRVMAAAAGRAVRAGFDALARVGFGPQPDRFAVEWWVEGPAARYQGASIGLGVALATVAAYTGTPVDKNLVVTGATDGDRVLPTTNLARKVAALGGHGFTTLLHPAENAAEVAAADPRGCRAVAVGTIEEAVCEVLGPALGLAKRAVARATAAPAAAVQLDVNIERVALPAGVGMRGAVPRARRPTFQVGDDVQLRVRPDRDCHLAVLNVSPDGQVCVLLPNGLGQPTRARGGEWFGFPPADGHGLTLTGPAGVEAFFVLASDAPLNLGPAAFEQAGDYAVVSGGRASAEALVRGIGAAVLGRAVAEAYVPEPPAEKVPTRMLGVQFRSRSAAGGEPRFRSLDLG